MARSFWHDSALTKVVIAVSTYLFMRFVIDHLPLGIAALRHRRLGELLEVEAVALTAALALNHFRRGQRPHGYDPPSRR
jgi:hypothetical protein